MYVVQIGFHTAKDGKEWVWVLGEAEGDLPYEDLVRKNNRKKADMQKIVPKGKYGEHRDGGLNGQPKKSDSPVKGDSEYDDDVFLEDEWKLREQKAKRMERVRKNSFTRAAGNHHVRIGDVLNTLSEEKQSTITMRLTQRRMSIQASKKPTAKPPAKVDPKNYPAVEFVSALSIRGTKPSGRHLTKQWFKEIERPKGVGQNVDGSVAEWFHGVIARDEAEDLLKGMGPGSYMVRVSDKIWGYVLSLKSDAGIKHFRIDASYGTYQMVDDGLGGPVHSSLIGLLMYYRQSGHGQILKAPCPQRDPRNPDYDDLMDDDICDNTTTYL